MKRVLSTWLSTLILMTTLLAACAPAATTATNQAPVTEPTQVVKAEAPVQEGMLLDVDPATVSGDIISAGSSTVFPLAEAVANLFEDEGYNGKITIDSIGSGAGFERFCKTGETDISNASRAIKDSERENCKTIGRDPIEFRVGTDALAIAVSQDNDFLSNVTLEELAQIFSTATKWSDVNPAWPNEDIRRFSPGTDSGTFDFFVESVMAPANKNADGKADVKLGEEAILKAANAQFSEDDNVLVQGIEGSPYAIGYFGFAYYLENAGKLKVLSVAGVSPNEQTAEDGTYQLARPLYIYSDAKVMQEKPQVAAFISFFLSRVNELIIKVGYFPASEEATKASMQTWIDAQK